MKEISIKTPFITMAAKVWGQGEPLLAIHGWLDNAASFDFLAPLLQGFEIVAIDLPGHGKSEHRNPDASYHFVDWVRYVFAAAESLDWKNFSLLGHSLGASIACFAAGVYPEKIKKMILVEGIGPWTDDADRVPGRMKRNLESLKSLEGKTIPIYHDLQPLIEKRQKVGNLPEPAARALMERSSECIGNGYRLRSDPRLKFPSPFRLVEEQVLAVMEKITCPVLLFSADNGLHYDKHKVEKRCEVIKDLKIVQVAGGHHVHMEAPQEIAKHIHDFISD